MKSNHVGVIVILLVTMLCCLCLCCLAVAGLTVYGVQKTETQSDFSFSLDNQTKKQPIDEEPAANLADIDVAPVSPGVYQEYETLGSTMIQKQDARKLAERLLGKTNIPEVLATSAAPVPLGTIESFWVTNTDTNESRQIEATLQYATPHVYFFVDNEVKYDQQDLVKLVDTFENKIYPTDHEFFGSEWSPGIDGDAHIYILYSRDLGINLAGYFSSTDSIPPMAAAYSNGHEMFLINADTVELWDEYIYGVLAHEFQHMIHWNLDSNEESWMNEGFSELATQLNGYDTGGFDYLYLSNPDLQLNDWPVDSFETSPHYGASFLYMTYFLDRFGETITKQLVRSEENGFKSIDDVLAANQVVDAQTGRPVLADDVFVDWTLANYLQKPQIGDGRYAYTSYNPGMTSSPNHYDGECLSNWTPGAVKQYGVDMIELDCPGKITLQVAGSNLVKVVPADPFSGKYAYWSNKGDDSDMTLTRSFDFSSVASGTPITMTYYTWFDIEEDYDYVYVLTSMDGENWQFVNTDRGTAANPAGNNLGWGYNGATGTWVQEAVDLSAFAGSQVYVRFEYVTDAAVNGEGFLLDDVAVPVIQYFEDFEGNAGGWQADGFVRIMNQLPQTFRVSLVDPSNLNQIQKYELNPGATLSVDLDFNQSGPVILFISGTTRYTRQPALYKIRFME